MKKLSAIYALSIALVGCGGSGADAPRVSDIEPGFGNDINEQFEANIDFYMPPFMTQKGELVITNLQDNTSSTHQVESLNQFSTVLTVGGQYRFKFEPQSDQVYCPKTTGCGRSKLNDPNDLNGNNEIDFGEPVDAKINLELVALPVPGLNQLFFSSFSHAVSADNYDSRPLSLTATPHYQLTINTAFQKRKAEYVANAMAYADIMQQYSSGVVNSSLFVDTFNDAMSQDSATWTSYAAFANEYLLDTLMGEETNILYREHSARTLLEVNELFNLRALGKNEESITPYSKDLLVEVRNALGVLRLQEEQYSEELKQKLEDVENIASNDAQEAFVTIGEVIGDVVKHVSPFEGSADGQYELPGLDITYETQPSFRWQVTGVRRGYEVNLDITVPEWRISPTLGDKIVGTGGGTVTKPGTNLEVQFERFEIVTTGSFDPSNIQEVVGISSAQGDLELTQQNAVLTGKVDLDLIRESLSIKSTKTIVPYLSINGVLNTPNQNTPIRIYANERSPLSLNEDLDLTFGVQLELALNGGKDLRMQLDGEPDTFSNFGTANIAMILGGHVSELTVTNVGGNINLIVRGKNGYWIDIKKKDTLFTGGFYFGDKLVGDVRTIRRVPGVLFPDGSFESLF
ncbi:hypothetical protein N474_15605 [Pseudoalteromonas luteoviolacea CPMOR-2]|uniref:Uncharacterized protein n=1 Tax=Pseudoalteromonas luteoviolacea DSM 6061 TaxID=1365250 RepID=A0A166YN16_9GAMM|nr:hypothetical protein [Pseudoalteromonas luteoviolacea]KZN43040.1 hypothetical protein N475_00235 [Pseudoalteromonas luteoviolacea DSM 6061]KZN55402.1 hypothetical protein N474_15605 [Pseudoalteromonas luteoviolacea CPMOR-2]MBE0385547.1 hypothetical protein [Pseudoalteromonas luteoviolacea DSM 6061]